LITAWSITILSEGEKAPSTPGLYEGRMGGGRCCSVPYLLAVAQAIELFDNDRLFIESKLGCDVVCSQVMLERERAGCVNDLLEECWALPRTRPRG